MSCERICLVEGCGNLGKTGGPGKLRKPLCARHRRERSPALAESRRAGNRRRRAEGRAAAGYAAQLLRGDQIWDYARHHAGMRAFLHLVPGDPLTASRTCPDTCPDSWLGWHSSNKVPYRLCIPSHYTAESQAANSARKSHSLP